MLFALGSFASSSKAEDWPEGYIVYQKSVSPDGHYGIVVQSKEAAIEDDTKGDGSNYLADLTTHRMLGKIDQADYFEGQNHRSLEVDWSADSKWAVATYQGRYGFDMVVALEPEGDKSRQIDFGGHIQTELDKVIAAQAHSKDATGYGMTHFRLPPDRKIKVRALAYTNPKAFENVPTYNAAFAGVFDLKSDKWISSTAHKISSDEFDLLESAYPAFSSKDLIVTNDQNKQVPEDFTGTVFSSEQEKAEYLEKKLNEIYKAVHLILPAVRFGKVREEQRAWLKKRDAMASIEEKDKETEARITSLQDLLW